MFKDICRGNAMMNAAEIFKKLYAAYGRPEWWSDDPCVIMVQAVLVQNTSWSSVEKVTAGAAHTFTPSYIMGLETAELEDLIRPCGFCKRKAATIFRLMEWYSGYDCDVRKASVKEQNELRKELLSIKGIGAETADVILVYALHKPSFIIDAYTRRFLERMGFAFSNDDEIRCFFENGLEQDYRIFGWYHWLILEHGINCCRKEPQCGQCPLQPSCASG